MSIKYRNPVQFELFPEKSSPMQAGAGYEPLRLKSLTLSPEHIIVLSIIVVMVQVVSFSLGVEKGKKGGAPARVPKPAASELQSSQQFIVKTVQEPVDPKDKGISRSAEPFPVVMGTSEDTQLLDEDESAKPDNLFTVQVASFKKSRTAEQEVLSLKEKGYNSDIFVLPKGSYSIVCVGKFPERNQAKEFAKRLRPDYNDYLIRRL